MKDLPGEIAHTDFVMISVPGIMPQMFGFHKSKKFSRVPFFIDDKLDYTFVNYQKSTLVDEMIKAKHAYEVDLWKFGKEIRHYHADNGTYSAVKCREEIDSSK